jgi:hypothetical protein
MISNQAERNVLNELLTNPDLLVTCRLFKNDPAPDDENIVLTDLEEADFDAYAAITPITWDSVSTNTDGDAETVSDVLHFERGAGSGGDQTVYGIYLTFTSFDTTGKLLWFTRFTTPFDFDSVGVFLEKSIDFTARQRV